MDTDDIYSQARTLTRIYIGSIWEAGKIDEASLDGEEAQIFEIMSEHPEFIDIWDSLEEADEDEIEIDGVNPLLHLSIHQTVENQVTINNPEITGQTIEKLIKHGMDRHEAIHAVGNVLIDEMFYMGRDKRPFDEKRFSRKMRRLVKSLS